MYWIHADFFWIFILVIVLVGTISRVIRSHQREKTIRTAIEKGVTLDPATLASLQASPAGNPRQGLLTGAIVTFFVGCGLALMGYVLNTDSNGETFRAMAAVGALLWCISLGLLLAGLVAKRS
ncbi:MAG: DUF6249 domain-containing protein [Rhizomicrobium sp.]